MACDKHGLALFIWLFNTCTVLTGKIWNSFIDIQGESLAVYRSPSFLLSHRRTSLIKLLSVPSLSFSSLTEEYLHTFSRTHAYSNQNPRAHSLRHIHHPPLSLSTYIYMIRALSEKQREWSEITEEDSTGKTHRFSSHIIPYYFAFPSATRFIKSQWNPYNTHFSQQNSTQPSQLDRAKTISPSLTMRSASEFTDYQISSNLFFADFWRLGSKIFIPVVANPCRILSLCFFAFKRFSPSFRILMESYNYYDKSDAHLPPGFRFHPTDEELITYYLLKKVLDSKFTGRAIAEVDLNKCEPWELPGNSTCASQTSS